jgi:hypothetical protein
MSSITIELCDWLYRAILHDSMMLTYNERYFDLGPIPRRLYEIARSHISAQDGFRINIEVLRSHVGAATPLKQFKYLVKQIVDADSLPDYGMALADERRLEDGPLKAGSRVPLKNIAVIFWRRRAAGPPADMTGLPQWTPDL